MERGELDGVTTEREQAVSRLKQRRDLQAHFVSYLVVNAVLWGIWAVSGGGYPWPAWVSGLWGVGLVLNVWDVLVRRPITEADVQREIERLRPKHEAGRRS